MVFLLLFFLTLAVIADARQGRIYNHITYPGILLGLVLNGIGTLGCRLGWMDPGELAAWGVIGLGQAVAGLLACGLVMVVCYVFFRIGGGDVKMIAMVGTYLGPEQGITAMLWTFVLGACLAIIVLIWREGPWRLVRHVAGRVLSWLRLGHWLPLTQEEKAALEPTLFLAPSAWLAVVIVRFALIERLLPGG